MATKVSQISTAKVCGRRNVRLRTQICRIFWFCFRWASLIIQDKARQVQTVTVHASFQAVKIFNSIKFPEKPYASMFVRVWLFHSYSAHTNPLNASQWRRYSLGHANYCRNPLAMNIARPCCCFAVAKSLLIERWSKQSGRTAIDVRIKQGRAHPRRR